MATQAATELLHCSFCGKSQEFVDKLIAGPAVYICNECVGLCDEILAEQIAGSLPRWEELPDDELLTRMADVSRSRERVDASVGVAVGVLRGRGVTWARIGDALGISRQSVWERYSGEE
jgi:hypothetical protein